MYKKRYLFFFNDTATTEIYTLSLHDALPILNLKPKKILRLKIRLAISPSRCPPLFDHRKLARKRFVLILIGRLDRKSTRLNSSHANISYAVFCLKKKTIFFTFNFSCIHYTCY